MDKKYRIDFTNGIAIARFHQGPGVDDILRAVDELAEIGSELRLWDFSQVSYDFTNAEIRAIAEYSKEKFTGPAKIAIVATENFSFGLSRIFEVYRREEKIAIMVFRTEQEAITWLKSASDAKEIL